MTYDPTTDFITDADITLFTRLRPSGPFRQYLQQKRTFADLIDNLSRACWLLWKAKHLTPERLDYCAARYPALALRYAAKYLSPERLDWCAAQEPYVALELAANLLTPERLDWCLEA